MKDFYDIWVLSKSASFEGDRLARAIAATFARRKTDLPAGLRAMLEAFAAAPIKQIQWNAFAADVLSAPPTFESVCSDIASFIEPHMAAAR